MAQGDRETSGVIDIATPDVTFPVSRHSFNPALAQIIDANSGDVDPRYAAVMSVSPVLSFMTRTITALSSFGIAGAEVTTAVAWLQQLVKYGTRNATSKKLTIATGFCVPRSLSVSQGQAAELSMDIVALSSDGTTAPVAAGTGTMATNPTPLAWTLGPIQVNDQAYDVVSMTIDFGLDVTVEGSEGNVYPTFATLMSRNPSVQFTAKDVDFRTAVGFDGLAQGATDSVFYLRKMEQNGKRVADGTAEHIKFTIDDGLFRIDTINAPHGERALTEIALTPISDGTNAIIVVDTASAIT